jgi:hypothetical protein
MDMLSPFSNDQTLSGVLDFADATSECESVSHLLLIAECWFEQVAALKIWFAIPGAVQSKFLVSLHDRQSESHTMARTAAELDALRKAYTRGTLRLVIYDALFSV